MGLAADAAPEKSSGAFEVWEPNWESLCCFLDCQTQWRVAISLAGKEMLGLDYPGVEVVLRQTKASDGVFSDLQTMELAALAAFGEG